MWRPICLINSSIENIFVPILDEGKLKRSDFRTPGYSIECRGNFEEVFLRGVSGMSGEN